MACYCTDLSGCREIFLWLHQSNATSSSVHTGRFFYFFFLFPRGKVSVVIAVSPPSPCSSLIFGTDGWSYGDRTAHMAAWDARSPPRPGAHEPYTCTRGRGGNSGTAARVPRGSPGNISEKQGRRFKHVVGRFAIRSSQCMFRF